MGKGGSLAGAVRRGQILEDLEVTFSGKETPGGALRRCDPIDITLSLLQVESRL
jgi:hypothetical protein